MNNLALKVLLISLVVLSNVESANAICLDYWLKGPSACKEDPEEKNRILIKGGKNINVNVQKDEARIAYEEDLNVQIDKFLAGYGKPPREFVAFHLDPSMENAVRWVRKFNEQHERTMKVAVAWRQADKIFKQYKATGEILLPADSGVTPEQIKYLKKAFEEDVSDLPEVKGFGIDLPGDWDEDRLSRNYNKLEYKDEDLAEAASKLSNTGKASSFSLGATEKKLAQQAKEAKANGYAKYNKPMKELAKPEKLEISYYFSAKCPFCKKFEPELTNAIESYGKENVSLTCVDMTPNDRKPANIKGKVDCKWRPLLTGEMKQFGIKKTPTLLVKRGESKALELLENYHSSKVLVNYFKNGAKR
ncbi:MAG TPA: hypothetical protein DCL21_00065 [Alphaproteobacteria bacterium]|nr:hypothetical protein [Alphaproteobacteria bacterium]